MASEETKNKIIQTTLNLLAREGEHKLTMRRIAEESGVNLAAMNYHFGSRENLIRESLSLFAEKTIGDVIGSITPELPARDQLFQFIDLSMQQHIKYPGYVRILFTRLIMAEETPPALSRMQKMIIEHLEALIQKISPDTDTKLVHMMISHIMSSSIHPTLVGNFVKDVIRFDYKNKEQREVYINMILDTMVDALKCANSSNH